MSTKHRITLGLVCLARKTFDWQAAAGIYADMRKNLAKLDEVEWAVVEELVIEPEDARKAAAFLATRGIDGLVCISGTFHLGHLVLELEKVLRKPTLLWGLDELPYDGGKIRLNSVCGVNLNASNLYKAGVRNYTVVIGQRIDEDWVDAIRIIARASARPMSPSSATAPTASSISRSTIPTHSRNWAFSSTTMNSTTCGARRSKREPLQPENRN